jgi:predicted dienelactone hydrolase
VRSVDRMNSRPVICGLFAFGVLVSACSSSDETTESSAAITVADVADTTPVTDTAAADTTAAPTTAAPTTEAPTTTEAPLAPLEDIGFGSYAVGTQTITVLDAARNRPLTVDVWFPLTEGVDAPLVEYTLIPGSFYRSPEAVVATPADLATDGPFPLVVYSHGSGGLRYIASYYTEAIASHGYVVVAPDHTGNTAVDRLGGGGDEFEVIALNRPNDVVALLDAFTDPAHPTAGAFAAAVDADHIAVTGHSFGGFTSLAVASGYTNSLGAVVADERVDAIIPLAPASGDGDGRLLSGDDLAAITIPMMIIAASDDKTTPIDPNVTRAWDLSAASPFYRVELVAAEHQSFTDVCDYAEFLPNLPDVLPLVVDTINEFAKEGCAPDDMPIDRAKSLTVTFAVGFLDAALKGGEFLDVGGLEIPEDVVLLAR